MARKNNSNNKICQQSGVIPYRLKDGKVEVLLITTRNRQSWVIPKGGICKGMTEYHSAAKEAWEEAGVIGIVKTEIFGSYKYRKNGNIYQVNLFLLSVDKVLEDWPEATQRERKWLDINQACKLVKQNSLKKLIAISSSQIEIISYRQFSAEMCLAY
jgi:8-oxo-dGTP pyrophosphatase MutT (NUDIX family)